MFINLLTQKYFLDTCSRQSSFLLANEISRYKSQDKVQICGKRQRASERRVNESDIRGVMVIGDLTN